MCISDSSSSSSSFAFHFGLVQIWANQLDSLRQVTRAYEIVLSCASQPVEGKGVVSHAKKEELKREMYEIDTRVLGILKEQEKKVVRNVKKGGKGPEAEMVRTFQINSMMLVSFFFLCKWGS